MPKKKGLIENGSLITSAIGDAGMGTLRARLTSYEVDRHGTVLVPQGVMLENYFKNPLLLLSHESGGGLWGDPHTMPIGRLDINSFDIANDSHIDADVQFDISKDEKGIPRDPEATTVFFKYHTGFMHTFSVGFWPLLTSEDQLLEGQKGDSILEWELAELSAVILPANPGAIALRKAELKILSRSCGPEGEAAFKKYYGELDTKKNAGSMDQKLVRRMETVLSKMDTILDLNKVSEHAGANKELDNYLKDIPLKSEDMKLLSKSDSALQDMIDMLSN